MGNVRKMMNTIKYFVHSIMKETKIFFGIAFIYIILNSIEPFVAIFITSNVISELEGYCRSSYFISQIIYLVISLVVIMLGKTLLNYKMNIELFALDDYYRENMGKRAMDMDYAFTENVKVLEQAEKATTGMSFYSGGVKGIVTDLINVTSKLITFIGTVYIISRIEIWVVLVLFLLTVLSWFTQFKIKKMDMNFWNSAVGINRTYSYFCDMAKDFKCGKDIRLHNAKGLVFDELDKFTNEFDSFSSKHFSKLSFWGVFEIVFLVVQLIIIYASISMKTVNGELSLGEFSLYIAATTLFSTSLKEFIEQILELRKKISFISEYVEFINIKNNMDKSKSKTADMNDFELEFENVSFHYPNSKDEILKNVNFKIRKGDKLSIVGVNGAGKTTFIKLLIRLYDPTEGRILLNGIDIREYDYKKYLELFAVVFQDFSLAAFSVKENIVINKEYNEERLNEVILQAGLEGTIKKLKYGVDTSIYKIFDEEGTEFSGGESQKLAIARANYKGSPILVLDEPTSALDPYSESEIYSRLNDLALDNTTVYISHRMSSCKFCERIIVFDNGHIVQEGSHDELVKNKDGIYFSLYNAQLTYYS